MFSPYNIHEKLPLHVYYKNLHTYYDALMDVPGILGDTTILFCLV